MNILVICVKFPDGFNQDFRTRLAAAAPGANIVYLEDQERSEQERIALLEQADVILGWFPGAWMKHCKRVKLIHLDSAGADTLIDNPDLPEGATLCNVSGAYGQIMAEHALGLLMAICRRIPYYYSNMARHDWHRGKPDKPIENSNVLILGAGDIGTNVARFLRPMLGSGSITGVRRVPREVPPEYDAMITFEALDQALACADIVISALPSTPQTAGLLNAERLRRMKADAVLINVGRGSLIPLDDLNQVLREGHLYGVGIDVAELEPIPPDHPVWDCEQLIITPHSAGIALSQTSPTYQRVFDIIMDNVSNFVNGRPLHNIVDRQTGYRRL